MTSRGQFNVTSGGFDDLTAACQFVDGYEPPEGTVIERITIEYNGKRPEGTKPWAATIAGRRLRST